jgi:hypothetical protein
VGKLGYMGKYVISRHGVMKLRGDLIEGIFDAVKLQLINIHLL